MARATALPERLKQAAIRDRDLDLEIANDWSAVDQEQWQRFDDQEEPPGRSTAPARRNRRRK